jgi:uncharacterized RDD family membrane protein YckC
MENHHIPQNFVIADSNDRSENFLLDFIISSIPAVLIAIWLSDSTPVQIGIYYGCRFLYYFISEAATGRTLAKLQTQTKVVAQDSTPAPLWCLAIRNCCRFFSVVSGISDDIKAVHDNLSGTIVVKDVGLSKRNVRIILIRCFIIAVSILVVQDILQRLLK